MKRAYARTGNSVKLSGSADQIDAPNGNQEVADESVRVATPPHEVCE